MLRDKKAAPLAGSNPNGRISDFNEVLELNTLLGEDRKTLELFRHLETAAPVFARNCWSPRLLQLFVRQDEFEQPLKYATDAAAAFENWKKRVSTEFQLVPEEMTVPSYYNAFFDDARALAEVARHSGNAAFAEQIEREAPAFMRRQLDPLFFRSRFAENSSYTPPEIKSGAWNGYFKVNRELLGQKKYKEVSERCNWYFHHAVEYDPQATGSLAISQWAEAGKYDPDALSELRKVREERANHLRTKQLFGTLPSWNPDGTMRDWKKQPPQTQEEWLEYFRVSSAESRLFSDVVAIDRCLNEKSRSIELFRQLDKNTPAFAIYAWFDIESECIEQKKYDLVRKYIPDIEQRYQQEITQARADLNNPKFNSEIRKNFGMVHPPKFLLLADVAQEYGKPDLVARIRQEAEEYRKQAENIK